MAKQTFKDTNNTFDVYTVTGTSTGANLSGKLEGDVVALSGAASEYTLRVSGNKLTITGINEFGKKQVTTISFDKKVAAGAQTVQVAFADGTATFEYTPGRGAKVTSGGDAIQRDTAASSLDLNEAITSDNAANANPAVPALGKTFTLTTGVDEAPEFVGTVGNDLFRATDATLNDFDSIDGAGGDNDTLDIVAADIFSLPGAKISNIENIKIRSTASVEVAGATLSTLDLSTAATGVKTVDVTALGEDSAVDLKSAAANSVKVVAGANALVQDVVAKTVSVVAQGGTAAVTAGNATVSVSATDGDALITAGNATVTATAVNGNIEVEMGNGSLIATASKTDVDAGATQILADIGNGAVTATADNVFIDAAALTTVTSTAFSTAIDAASIATATVNGALLSIGNVDADSEDQTFQNTVGAVTFNQVIPEEIDFALPLRRDSDVGIVAKTLGTLTLKSAAVDGSDEDLVADFLANVSAEIALADSTSTNLVLNGANASVFINDIDTDDEATPDVNEDIKLTTVNVAVNANALNNALSIGTSASTLNISGAGNVTVGEYLLGENATIDASRLSGNISITVNTPINYKGGSGVDTVTLNAVPVDANEDGKFDTTIDGGAGSADVLGLDADDAEAAADLTTIVNGATVVTDRFNNAVKGFEVLSLTDADNQIVDANAFGIKNVVVDFGVQEEDDFFKLNLANDSKVTFKDDGIVNLTVQGADAESALPANFKVAVVAQSDLDLSVANVGVIALESADLNVGEMEIVDTNAISLNAADATSLTVTGNAGASIFGTSAIKTLNASGNTGGININDLMFAAAGIAFTGTAASDELTINVGSVEGTNVVNTIKTGTAAAGELDVVNVGSLNASMAGTQVRVTLSSGDVGNGTDNNVTLQVDQNNVLLGGVSTSDDEGVRFNANGVTFDVRGADGVQRGDKFNVVVLGTSGKDEFTDLGRDENYYVNAGAGNDIVVTGSGEDFLVGGAGNDFLNGGAGADKLLGGAGNDEFAFFFGDNLIGGSNDDTVLGFVTGADKLVFDNLSVLNDQDVPVTADFQFAAADTTVADFDAALAQANTFFNSVAGDGFEFFYASTGTTGFLFRETGGANENADEVIILDGLGLTGVVKADIVGVSALNPDAFAVS